MFLAQETRNLFRHHGTVKRSKKTTAISLDLSFNNIMRVSIFKFLPRTEDVTAILAGMSSLVRLIRDGRRSCKKKIHSINCQNKTLNHFTAVGSFVSFAAVLATGQTAEELLSERP